MTRELLVATILATAVLAGCGRDSTPAESADAAAQRATEAKTAADAKATADASAAAEAKTAANAEAVAAKAAADAKQEASRESADAAKTASDTKTAAALQKAQVAKEAADAKIAADLKSASNTKDAADAAAKTAAETTTARAEALLTQLTTYIRDNKWDLADKTLAQLDEMKGSLPGALQTKIETARTALQTAKASSALH